MSKKSKSVCKYCKFINEYMPLEKDRGREVTEIRYSTKDNNSFYWGHYYRVPLNFCPNCGAKMVEPRETETWNGIHAQITAPKGTFERIFNDADYDIDI